jgi:hypothetical protein
VHPNYSDTRQLFLRNTLTALAKQYTPDQLQSASAAIKEHIDTTYTDQVLFQQFQAQAAEKRAKEAQELEQCAADLQAKAAATVTAGHNAKLTTERAKTTKATKNAEYWEGKFQAERDRADAMFKAQRTGGR